MTIELVNQTPYPAVAWDYLNVRGDPYGIGLLRGRFMLEATGNPAIWTLVVDPDQGELFDEDQYVGEPGQSSLRYETDFVPYKSGTDIVANAIARAPGGTALKQWHCGIRVEQADGKVCCQKVLNVTGPRQWQAGLLSLEMSTPRPCLEVPIRYEHAYGGSRREPGKDGQLGKSLYHYAPNPAGVGKTTRFDDALSRPAPQIEAIQQPITAAGKEYEPQGFGFVPRLWQPRLALAGCYDDQWLAEKHPLLPDDFNPEHFRSASVGLAMADYLAGGETVTLAGFAHHHTPVQFKLPDYRFYSSLVLDNGEFLLQPLHLDTVLLDIEASDPVDWRVYLSWRGQHLMTDRATQLELFGLDNAKESTV